MKLILYPRFSKTYVHYDRVLFKDGERVASQRSRSDWGDAPYHVHAPGPNASKYERFRESAGAHLVFNAFWQIQHFCVHQMLMRDPMHQIDLGAIIHLIKAILRKFNECVEAALEQYGLAAKRLGKRFRLMLAKRKGRDGQRYAL